MKKHLLAFQGPVVLALAILLQINAISSATNASIPPSNNQPPLNNQHPIKSSAQKSKHSDTNTVTPSITNVKTGGSTLRDRLKDLAQKNSLKQTDNLIFDIPVTYNNDVSRWIQYYQTKGHKWFKNWLERGYRFMPLIQDELKKASLPLDLAYIVMIESGFSPTATSNAEAVGPWQFIAPTGARYGLKKNWWLDERKDLKKSTLAAIRYLRDLYSEFGSWYLVAASYNMGEGGLRRQIKKFDTHDYWALVKNGALPGETQEYVPKILAAMLISKAPNLYGFRDVEKMDPIDYDIIKVPGGTELEQVADLLGVTRHSIRELNAELILGYIPKSVVNHYIRVPRGSGQTVAESNYVSRRTK